jgi:hypothetical protein
MGKTFKKYSKPSSTENFREEEDNFETFGYDVQNARRTPKNKKVTKFKDYDAYEY